MMRCREGLIVISSTPKNLPEARVSKAIDTDKFVAARPTPMVLWKPGFPEWERKIMLASRTLSVITGHPGHGKIVPWTQIW